MPLHFVVDDLGAGVGDVVVLGGSEAHHAASVRRLRRGEVVSVGDGRGGWAEAVCEEADPRQVRLRIASRCQLDPPAVRIELVQALAKGDRDELAVQTATELGVDVVTPWQAARSVSRWDAAKRAKGLTRWRSIAREAGKQAHRGWLPEVRELTDLPELRARASHVRMLVLEPSAAARLSQWQPSPSDSRDIVLLVGPEGGISSDELAALESAGALLVRLGEEVLRTSSAGPAALAVLSDRLGRW